MQGISAVFCVFKSCDTEANRLKTAPFKQMEFIFSFLPSDYTVNFQTVAVVQCAPRSFAHTVNTEKAYANSVYLAGWWSWSFTWGTCSSRLTVSWLGGAPLPLVTLARPPPGPPIACADRNNFIRTFRNTVRGVIGTVSSDFSVIWVKILSAHLIHRQDLERRFLERYNLERHNLEQHNLECDSS